MCKNRKTKGRTGNDPARNKCKGWFALAVREFAKAGTDVGPLRTLRIWGGPGVKQTFDHLTLEIIHASWYRIRGGKALGPGDPVPGCSCPTCTGISERDPIRTQNERSHRSGIVSGGELEAAQGVPITKVCQNLGLGKGTKRGREVAFLCPLHDDKNPSLRVNVVKNVGWCDVCGLGGDGIWLVREVRRIGFREAVEYLLELA